MPEALANLRIVDFSRVLAGPLATMVLADLGAEVVKVERPGVGDDTRAWGPPYDETGMATYFQAVNRNKQSVALDLRDADGLARARALLVGADVLVENFRPGVMDRLGLGYEALHVERPRLVYCSITGFGAGAGAPLPGYDLLVQALGGLMSITGAAEGEPQKVGVALVDVICGLFAAVGILAALRHRERAGEGQRVELDLLSCLLAALVNQGSAYTLAGEGATRTRASRRTNRCAPPTRSSSWRSAPTRSSARWHACSARRSWPTIPPSPPTRRASPTASGCASSCRRTWRERRPPTGLRG
jgi:crotonobetainyl-CoA:carnitine CoA-transferase CaiB-like acyl-CoA transferase